MSPDVVAGLLIVALAVGILIGATMQNTRLLIQRNLARGQRDAALRHARIAAGTAYRASVELEKAERDLWVMDGGR